MKTNEDPVYELCNESIVDCTLNHRDGFVQIAIINSKNDRRHLRKSVAPLSVIMQYNEIVNCFSLDWVDFYNGQGGA